MAPRQGYRRRARGPLAGQHLVDADFPGLELQRAGRHVEPPHPIRCFIDVLQRARAIALESCDPVPQGQCIVRPQPLDIRDLELRTLHAALYIADGIELSVRKYVSIDEFGGHRRRPALAVMRNAVIQK